MSADVTLPNPFPSYTGDVSSLDFPPRTASMPYLTQQYALPIHHTPSNSGILRDTGYDNSGSREQTPRAENTLRRKTPNGTLNAGYDASADLTTPPLKHQLLPLSEGNASRPIQISLPAGKRTFLQHHHLQRQNAAFGGGWTNPGGSGFPLGAQLPQLQNAFPVDSMLNQGLPAHPHSVQQPFYGHTVPSVIQPSFQYVGPTASGGQGSGPYGPYWHDGTYVPYRPAAVRDPRFYHVPPPHFSGPLPNPQLGQHPSVWQQPTPVQTPWSQVPGHSPFVPPSMHFPQGHQHPPQEHIFSPAANVMPHDPRYHSVAPGTTVPPFPYGIDHRRESSSVEAEFGPGSPNARQRERTFSWALQQYRDLLAFIHHTRRQEHHSRQANGRNHVPPRPNFYPKPPRQSPSGSALQLPRNRTDTDVPQGQPSDDPPISIQRADSAPGHHSSDSSTPKARSLSVWSPSGIHLHDSEYHRRASHDQFQRTAAQHPANPLIPQEEKHRTLRRSTGSSVSAIVSPIPQDDSPPSRAAAALQQITTLCQETDWQWIDGMHLGGCLSYGLGHYQKALRWYNKVLERDPKHLEATSNLAATMLALGKRQEAEQNWMQVLKVAPNHFEAVEHLVGLLCSEHRSKEAIKVIEHVERCLRQPKQQDTLRVSDRQSECSSSTASRSPCTSERSDKISYDFEADGESPVLDWRDAPGSSEPGFGSSGFGIPGCDNGRILALIHAKGNMLYGLGDNGGAGRAFEDAVLIAAGRKFDGIQGLVQHILTVVASSVQLQRSHHANPRPPSVEPILLSPDQALATAKLCFPHGGELPGLRYVPGGPQSLARKAVISTTSNSLLSLAKIFQDGMSNAHRSAGVTPLAHGVRDILALYYLSLSLQPSPSTANNVGILLASVQQASVPTTPRQRVDIPGVAQGSGIALALQYYNYGLQLDQHHAHLYTNLGSLLKDIGQLDAAINMYERAVKCDGKFDIALANLANAVKDKGRISDAIEFYRRAVDVNPDFAEAVCGLANALNSVCGWQGRGGIAEGGGKRDRWHVDAKGMLLDARQAGASSSGWIKRVVDIVEKQLVDGENWGNGTLSPSVLDQLIQQVTVLEGQGQDKKEREQNLRKTLSQWSGHRWEGARVTRLVERAIRRIGWHWYCDTYVKKKQRPPSSYNRPLLPAAITVSTAPTVLPFHTFTCPMSAKQIRLISQRNGLRISVSTLRSPWLPKQVFFPPKPPAPYLRVGYVSSDFNNHPLAHLMQSVFGLHDRGRVEAYCYATTASDHSIHRLQIQKEAPVFHDASAWSVEKLVNQIVADGIHILVNLNGYTRGARNEVFAARPAPIQMSFMGFAGTLGAEWCDYLLADETAVPVDTLRPWRRNVDLEDQLVDENSGGENEDWVYGENIIYCRDTFFCCDHKQSASDAHEKYISWEQEQKRRWQMRKDLFPQISDDTIIFGNFNQLYKIEPTTFRTWLRILARVPNSILWLLRFPDLGESHLLNTARLWAGEEVASRVVFTDVAPKHLHISRARICDLVVDTAECNAHTTAADVLWSGTPLLTLPRYQYKMCSRMAASILKGALPRNEDGERAGRELIALDEEDYEEKAVALGRSFAYVPGGHGVAEGRLMELRKMLFHARWSSGLFDTKRWVRDLEDAYDEAWKRWVSGEGGDIWLDQVPRGGKKHLTGALS